MPTLDTATVYPGMCLLEGTNLSEGRGTTRPFELFGAPYIFNPHSRNMQANSKEPPYEYERERLPIDIVAGTDQSDWKEKVSPLWIDLL